MQRDLDSILAYHCAPALLGRKPANLVTLNRAEFPDLEERVEDYTQMFAANQISFRLLCRCDCNCLLLVYRGALLEQQIFSPLALQILRLEGYGGDDDLEKMLDRLGWRLEKSQEFPHEIGLFLGYPPEDVRGFQIHRGQDCKFCGYWKVYSDVERAKALFRVYDRCREYLCTRLAGGLSLRDACPVA